MRGEIKINTKLSISQHKENIYSLDGKLINIFFFLLPYEVLLPENNIKTLNPIFILIKYVYSNPIGS